MGGYTMIQDFISQYGLTLIYAALTAIAGFIAAQIRKIYQQKVDNLTKQKVVETCVKAVEQLYQDINGAEKLEKAKDSIIQMLSEKGIVITDLELDMMIEAVVAEFNFHDLRIKKAGDTSGE